MQVNILIIVHVGQNHKPAYTVHVYNRPELTSVIICSPTTNERTTTRQSKTSQEKPC